MGTHYMCLGAFLMSTHYINFNDLNTNDLFTVADLNVFKSLGNSSNRSRNLIFREILGKFS